MTEIEATYVGGPRDGNTEPYEPTQIAEFLAKGFYVQLEEAYDPRKPGRNPVHRYDLVSPVPGELELRYAGIMPRGTFTPGRVDNYARPDAEVPDDDPWCD